MSRHQISGNIDPFVICASIIYRIDPDGQSRKNKILFKLAHNTKAVNQVFTSNTEPGKWMKTLEAGGMCRRTRKYIDWLEDNKLFLFSYI